MREVQSLQLQSYEYLLNVIKEGSLEPGKIYSLNKMAKDAGLSRTPFRDAVMKLEQERYIDVIPSKGFMLHQMSKEDIVDTYQFREALEVYCLKQLASNLKTERGQSYFGKLKGKVLAQKDILDAPQTETSAKEFAKKDYEFHRSIIQYLGNESMLDIYRTFMYSIRRLNINSYKREHRMEEAYEEHKRILNLVEMNEAMGLENLMQHHLNIAKDINFLMLEAEK